MKCNIVSHALHYCKVQKIAESLLFLSCGDLTGNKRTSSLGTLILFWRTAGRRLANDLVSTEEMYCCDVMAQSSNTLVAAWSRARSTREAVSLRPFLGLVLGQTVYISRVTFIYFYVSLLERTNILRRDRKNYHRGSYAVNLCLYRSTNTFLHPSFIIQEKLEGKWNRKISA